MSDLLDWSGAAIRPFRPQSISEFFALQLARKLDDEANVGRYARFVENHSHD